MISVAHTFDSAAIAYEQQLQLGLSLSGETADYFVSGRVTTFADLLKRYLTPEPVRLLDFGCGVGNATGPLLETFPNAQLTGLDCSPQSLAVAQQKHASHSAAVSRLQWSTPDAEFAPKSFDAVYTSGVFHHIAPQQRQAELTRLRGWLRPHGVLALFENNPWNPGTRWVMSRIPFDRDAICLTPGEARQRLQDAGFELLQTRYLFFFPRPLSGLRRFERRLGRVPLGAQYVVLARCPLS